MRKNLFESITSFFKGLICGPLLVAASAAALTFAFIVVMTCIRGCGSLWRNLFSQPWP